MSLNERFRIDELVKKGSSAIPRDDSGSIVVRRIDGVETKPQIVKQHKPFGIDPIRGKQKEPKLKTDLLQPQEEVNVQQTSFSGETSDYLEQPYYDRKELERAVDVKVDELIKPKKEPKERYIKFEKYEAKLVDIADLTDKVIELELLVGEKNSQIANLESVVLGLQSDVVAAQERLKAAESEFESLKNRYEELLADFQNAVLKGTREGIERVSLTAQVKGLGAQKETLASQLESERGIVKNLQDTLVANQQIAQNQIQAANDQVKSALATATSAANSKKKKIICNELYHQGYLSKEIWIADENFGDWLWETHRTTAIGYTIWARKVVNFMQRKPQYTKYIYKFLKPWTQQMAYQMGVVDKTHPFGWLTMKIGWQFSNLVYSIYGNEFEKLLSRVNKIG